MERDTQRGIQPQGIYSKEISEKWKVEKPEVKAKYKLDAEHDMAVYHAQKEEEQRAAREVEGAQPAGQTAAGDEGTGLHQGRTSPPGLPGLIPSSGSSAHASSPGPNTPPSASGQLSHPPFQPQAPEKDDSHGLTQDEYNDLVRHEQHRRAMHAQHLLNMQGMAFANQNTTGFTMRAPPPQRSPVAPAQTISSHPPGHPYARAPAPSPSPSLGPAPLPQPQPQSQQRPKSRQTASRPKENPYAPFQAQLQELLGRSFEAPLEEDPSCAEAEQQKQKQKRERGRKRRDPKAEPKLEPVIQSMKAFYAQVEELGPRTSAAPQFVAPKPAAPQSEPGKPHRSVRHNVAHAPPVLPTQRRMGAPPPSQPAAAPQSYQPAVPRPPHPYQCAVPHPYQHAVPHPYQHAVPHPSQPAAPRQPQHPQFATQPSRWNSELGPLNAGFMNFAALPPMYAARDRLQRELLLAHAYQRQFDLGFRFPGPPMQHPGPPMQQAQRAPYMMMGRPRPPVPAMAAFPPGWNMGPPAPSRGMHPPSMPFNGGMRVKVEDTGAAVPSGPALSGNSLQRSSASAESRGFDVPQGWNAGPASSRGVQAQLSPFNGGVKVKVEDTSDGAPFRNSSQPGLVSAESPRRRYDATAMLDDAPYAFSSEFPYTVSERSPSSSRAPAQQPPAQLEVPTNAPAEQASSSGSQRVGQVGSPAPGSATRPISLVDAEPPSGSSYPSETLPEDATRPEDLPTSDSKAQDPEALLESWFTFC
ncbi:hypothetical protein TRAPUB_979 [Trametes pubescens]|uniref:Uncharacterized protein n=1 Tax=Trametes pubescens TaxID=154538 RepID=A0A1M2VKJ5_TRAPU|nr:hypothetical protein TRAPUB_979 [Trametes pubescens]